MPQVHALFWFDTEDCMVPQSDDCAKRLALILEQYGVTGTFKVVGQKARVLEQRIRYDVIDVLQRHEVGYHSNWHGGRPQIAEYLAPLGFDDGAAVFDQRERPGLEDVRRVLGRPVWTYGQPGPNWAPQVFPVLRQWGIPTYISGFGYVGVDCQPFWYGGVLCTSHCYGERFSGERQQHHHGLNFELGREGELAKHQARFSQSVEQLKHTGGFISVLNHPCTLVLEEWFSTYLKSREETEAGYQHFEAFVKWALALDGVTTTSASKLGELYPDHAISHAFDHDELLAIADALSDEVCFVRVGEIMLSAAEACAVLVNALAGHLASGEIPREVPWRWVDHPRHHPPTGAAPESVRYSEFAGAALQLVRELGQRGRVPDLVQLPEGPIAPADFLTATARVVASLLRGDSPPDEITLHPAVKRFESYVDPQAAEGGWRSVMLPDGFTAPNLVELARLGAWTLKPAVLVS